MYDEVLGFRVLKEATLIGFAHGLVMVEVAKHPQDMELYGSKTNDAIKA